MVEGLGEILEKPAFVLDNSNSQTHRMVGVGRDLCGSSSPTPLPKQIQLLFKSTQRSSECHTPSE